MHRPCEHSEYARLRDLVRDISDGQLDQLECRLPSSNEDISQGSQAKNHPPANERT